MNGSHSRHGGSGTRPVVPWLVISTSDQASDLASVVGNDISEDLCAFRFVARLGLLLTIQDVKVDSLTIGATSALPNDVPTPSWTGTFWSVVSVCH